MHSRRSDIQSSPTCFISPLIKQCVSINQNPTKQIVLTTSYAESIERINAEEDANDFITLFPSEAELITKASFSKKHRPTIPGERINVSPKIFLAPIKRRVSRSSYDVAPKK